VRAPLVLVTGFGPFRGRTRNPSREIARALEREPPPGVRVLARELPVTFRGAPRAIRRALADLAPERPAALLGLGVQGRPWFRLERRARGVYSGRRQDNAGHSPASLGLDLGPERECALELEPLALVLRAAGAGEVRISDDAGGFVCEVCFHTLLGEARGAPAVFLHVPPVRVLDAAAQTPIVRALVAALADYASSSSSSRGRASSSGASRAAKARKSRTRPKSSKPM
jgi:pyroglutamyl-peptidase